MFCVSVRSSWFLLLFKYSSISLLTIYLVVFINESGLLKSPAIITKLPVSPFNSLVAQQ